MHARLGRFAPRDREVAFANALLFEKLNLCIERGRATPSAVITRESG
jgi:hypothetical protein